VKPRVPPHRLLKDLLKLKAEKEHIEEEIAKAEKK